MTSFYNSMWLVANDIIIGATFGSFLFNNSEHLANIFLKDYKKDMLVKVHKKQDIVPNTCPYYISSTLY